MPEPRKNAMRGYGLIGFPLSHSFSSLYFAAKFKKESIAGCYYKNFPLEDINELPLLVAENPELLGLNVTIPYKEKVITFLDYLDEGARSVGAVNTVKIVRSTGSIHMTGYNTDVYGFQASIEPLLKPVHKKALVLGTGGASKAVGFALKGLGIRAIFVSRRPRQSEHIGYQDLTASLIAACPLIINTSPVGMHPHDHESPDIPYQHITPQHVLYDLIYNPEETAFIKEGKKRGAVTANGLDMLYLQAEKAWEIWNTERS
jgi:shikimate dehydrogenase